MSARLAGVFALLPLAGCVDGAPPPTPPADDRGPASPLPDAGPPDLGFEWRIFVSVLDPDSPVTVRIDGLSTHSFVDWYDSEEEVRSEAKLVETLVDGTVVSRVWVPADCDHACGNDDWFLHKEHWFAYASGELRLADRECTAWFRPCESSFVDARCRRDGCPDARCGIDRVDADPSLGWLDCVPIGSRVEGEACSVDGAGIDDCGANLHCVGGACRRACELELSWGEWVDLGHCGDLGACGHVPGMSPEVGVCPPVGPG